MATDTPENRAKIQFERFIVKKTNIKLFTNLRGAFWTGQMVSNNGGTAVIKFARRLKAGCGPDGMPDLIGWKQIKITEDMIGITIAQFCAVEIKRFDGKGKISAEQIDMIELINKQGGFARLIDSIEAAEEYFGTP